jgi:hypothetical protein
MKKDKPEKKQIKVERKVTKIDAIQEIHQADGKIGRKMVEDLGLLAPTHYSCCQGKLNA